MLMNLKSGRTHLLLAMAISLVISFSQQAVAAKAPAIAASACDPQYYKSLSARAWLEAQREITQNQNIILKPDSVFEYTCFGSLLGELAAHDAQMLSGTNAFGSPLGASSMDSALNNLVGTSLITYIYNNYGHGLLGGHSAANGIGANPKAISAGSYSCDVMKRVWKAAKCINFVTYANNDGFHSFDEYGASSDKRHLPTVCKGSADWGMNITAAKSILTPVDTYIGLITAEKCLGNTCKCSGNPIPTGVKVKKKNVKNTFDEKICLQPGCRYHPGGFALYKGGPNAGAGCYGR